MLIALRNPDLLGGVRRVDTRILWVVGDPKYLGNAQNADLLASYAPRLLFLTEHQAAWGHVNVFYEHFVDRLGGLWWGFG